MRRVYLCCLLLACLANRGDGPPVVRFLQPRASVILVGPYGSDIPVQLRIPPHADNRSYTIAWVNGQSSHTLDGDNDAAVQPIAPLKVRVYAGRQDLIAEVYGPGGKVRGRAVLPLKVCGGLDDDGC